MKGLQSFAKKLDGVYKALPQAEWEEAGVKFYVIQHNIWNYKLWKTNEKLSVKNDNLQDDLWMDPNIQKVR